MARSPGSPGSGPSGGNYTVQISRSMLLVLGAITGAFLLGVGVLVSGLVERSGAAAAVTTTAKAGVAVARPTATAHATATAIPSPTPDGIIKVYITGEVQKPGVYEMHSGERVLDAVLAAGGFTEYADQARVDQAVRVKDEMRIDIPHLASTPVPPVTVGPGTPVSTLIPLTATSGDSRINVNSASAAELDRLPGIGVTISQRIVEFRQKNGPFKSLADLRKVEGVTNSIIEKIKDLIIF